MDEERISPTVNSERALTRPQLHQTHRHLFAHGDLTRHGFDSDFTSRDKAVAKSEVKSLLFDCLWMEFGR